MVIGDGWDVDNKKLLKSVRTSIRVEFDRDMDAASFQPGDFKITVDALSFTPTAVAGPFAGMPNSVFLTVPELAPDATVKVEIVGAVADKGGNAITAEIIVTSKIADGIAPKLTVTLVNNYTKADINWSTKSDEKIVGSLPTTDIFPCSGEATTKTCAVAVVVSTPSSTIITQRQEWSFELKGLAMGRYNMKVSARDTAGNTGSAGTGTGDPTATGALTFEIDKAFPAAKSTTLATDPVATVFTKTTDAPVFIITIDWTNEGTEYTGDTHANVTLTKAELDGASVMAFASEKDNIVTIAISGIGVGKHTLVYNAKDDLGNTRATDEKLNFEVVTPPPFTLNLNTGMNLISLPRDPANTDVNAVFGGTEEISLIFTRPLPGESAARWLIASATR